MIDFGRFFHPRRLWLWSIKYKEIQITADGMLPSPYRIDNLISEYRPDVAQLKAAGVLKYKKSPTLNKAAKTTHKKINNKKLHEAILGAAEGAFLYGHDMLDQLYAFDGEFAHALANGLKTTLLNSSNLSVGLVEIANLTQAGIPSMFLPLAQPIINHCVQNAETWCYEHLVGVSDHANGMSNTINATAGSLHEAAWIDPAGSVTSHPIDVMASHFEHADTVGHAGDVLDHGVGASEVAGHAADHASAGFHVPWFTVLRSGHREFQLLQDGKTDMGAAAKNFSIDTGAMLAGAKAGALAGSIFGPIGAAVGGALGGIGGKLFGNEIKQNDLKAAVTSYEKHVQLVNQNQQELQLIVTSEFNRQKHEKQRKLDIEAQRLISEAMQSASSFSHWGATKITLRSSDTEKIMSEALAEIKKCVSQLNQQLSGISVFKRTLWPNMQAESIRLAISMATKKQHKLNDIATRIHSQGEIRLTELLNMLAVLGMAEEAVRDMLQHNEFERKQRVDAFQLVLQNNQKIITEKRFNAIAQLDILLKELAKKVELTIEPAVFQLNKAGEKVVREKQKLGMA